jgi:hypothetical protein
MKVVAGKFEVTSFGLRERSHLSIFAVKRRKAHFFVETVTLPFFGSSAVSPSQRFEYPPDDRASSSRTGCGFVRTRQGGKEMSMSSKPNRKRIAELQAASTPAETGEDSLGNSTRNEEIRRRAYEIYLERGEQPGRELDDWLQAERELERGIQTNLSTVSAYQRSPS